MRIRAGFEITYECPAPTPMLLMLNVHPSRAGDLETPDCVRADPAAPITPYVDGFGNLCGRVLLPPGRTSLRNDFVVRDTGALDAFEPDAPAIPVEDLPHEVLVYLLGSRYCETDRMVDLAWSLFGRIPPGWGRVQAIVSYAHERIEFGYHHARPTKTALDAHEEAAGVCRDYAHLAITLCRCMNIPARYCTGYLGDIGVEPSDAPMDFSAWFEVYLGGAWFTFDARHDRRRIGRILMARGRDAADTAITTSFGFAALVGFTVVTDLLE
jgi:transglutaminase-like putative cysteine protease